MTINIWLFFILLLLAVLPPYLIAAYLAYTVRVLTSALSKMAEKELIRTMMPGGQIEVLNESDLHGMLSKFKNRKSPKLGDEEADIPLVGGTYL